MQLARNSEPYAEIASLDKSAEMAVPGKSIMRT
jgi:hypothetical protein